MGELIGLAEISHTLNVTHDYARDRVVKRPDFPRPAISLSQKCRRWKKFDFDTWLRRMQRAPERSPVLPPSRRAGAIWAWWCLHDASFAKGILMSHIGAALRSLELAAAQLTAYSAVRRSTALGSNRTTSVVSARFVAIELASSLTGFTRRAIESKIQRGDWLEGQHWVKRGGRVLIDMQGYERWAEGANRNAD